MSSVLRSNPTGVPELSKSFVQACFLVTERLLGKVFGERLNPLHYLGAITYFLLWIVIATGLYLYAFFETGVAGAYSSVTTLTDNQPWAGGLVRSLHRYASDALVVGMLLHLVRHWAFGHYRGSRWFSWVTGVLLLWLAFASGINGYMLPWDRLSQFVVTLTTEWLDSLPLIGGAMTRNFISSAHVGDRLFSLLSFIHIGLPLGLLAVLWIHTQRTPGAHTNPPRPLAAGIFASLVALSIVKPAVSQGPIDLAIWPASVNFDWFYLALYPLIEIWGAGHVWLLAIGATFLLAAVPLLTWRRRGRQQARSLAVHPDERIIMVEPGETLLDAGLRAGLPMPFECRNGGCGACKADLLYGKVHLQPFQATALTPVERADRKILLCCAEPVTDVEIAYVPQSTAIKLPTRQYRARVARLDLLSADVMRLCLRLEGDGSLPFHAGQYINILLADGARRSFSFATAPHAADGIELHVRLVPGGRFTSQVFTQMKVGDSLELEGPLGAFTLHEDSGKPIIFVAGSTGFAPIKSMVEHAFHTGLQRQMVLYWGVRRKQDLYLGDLAGQWAREHPNFTFIPVLSAPGADDAWSGRVGLVHEAILADYPDLSRHQIYACGSVQMVEAAQPAFMHHGAAKDDCFSDAFHLAAHRAIGSASAELVKLGGSNV